MSLIIAPRSHECNIASGITVRAVECVSAFFSLLLLFPRGCKSHRRAESISADIQILIRDQFASRVRIEKFREFNLRVMFYMRSTICADAFVTMKIFLTIGFNCAFFFRSFTTECHARFPLPAVSPKNSSDSIALNWQTIIFRDRERSRLGASFSS